MSPSTVSTSQVTSAAAAPSSQGARCALCGASLPTARATAQAASALPTVATTVHRDAATTGARVTHHRDAAARKAPAGAQVTISSTPRIARRPARLIVPPASEQQRQRGAQPAQHDDRGEDRRQVGHGGGELGEVAPVLHGALGAHPPHRALLERRAVEVGVLGAGGDRRRRGQVGQRDDACPAGRVGGEPDRGPATDPPVDHGGQALLADPAGQARHDHVPAVGQPVDQRGERPVQAGQRQATGLGLVAELAEVDHVDRARHQLGVGHVGEGRRVPVDGAVRLGQRERRAGPHGRRARAGRRDPLAEHAGHPDRGASAGPGPSRRRSANPRRTPRRRGP